MCWFSQDFADYGTWRDGRLSGKFSLGEGWFCRRICRGFPAGTTWVDVRIGSSFIDFEQLR